MDVIIAATADNPYIVVALCGAVSTLFVALGKVALTLLDRSDKAHAELVLSMSTAHAAELIGKDALLASTQTRCDEWEQRANRYEMLVMRSLEAAREAAAVAHIAADAAVNRGSSP
jgi:hypothetical protein